jgi:hypothetical protein
VLLLILSGVSTAQSTEPCKECFLMLCQNTPTGVTGKDSCSNAPTVNLQCTVGPPGWLACGVTFTAQCVSSGGVCMNWMEFVWVSGAMESPECEETSHASKASSPRRSSIPVPARVTG